MEAPEILSIAVGQLFEAFLIAAAIITLAYFLRRATA